MDLLRQIQIKVAANAIDGVWGPITNKAVNKALGYRWNTGVKALQTRLGVAPDGEVGPITLAAIWEALGGTEEAQGLVAVAARDLGIRETSHNQGPGIEKFWTATSYHKGYVRREPWCAAAVCYWVAKAAEGREVSYKLPTTPLAFGFMDWAYANKLRFFDNPKSIKAGQIVIYRFSHIGIATEDSQDGYVNVIEGNTTSGEEGNQRDGGGVYIRKRKVSLVKMAITLPE